MAMSLVIVPAAVLFCVLASVLWILRRSREHRLAIDGKYVLITGCDSGFGRETAICLDKMGVNVLATCLTKEGEKSLKSVTSKKMKTFLMDVTNSQQIGEVFDKVKEVIDDHSGKENKIYNQSNQCSVGLTNFTRYLVMYKSAVLRGPSSGQSEHYEIGNKFISSQNNPNNLNTGYFALIILQNSLWEVKLQVIRVIASGLSECFFCGNNATLPALNGSLIKNPGNTDVNQKNKDTILCR